MAHEIPFGTVHDRYDPPRVSGLDASGESKTQQEFKKECDINNIMARYLRAGVFPPNVKVGRYGDFSEVGEYREALETLAVAEAQFKGLPSKVRERFKNDPGNFLAWLRSKDFNMDEAQEIGILSEEAVKRRIAEIEAKKAKPPEPDIKK